MMIRIDIERPDYDRNGSLLFRLQVHKFCMAVLARWVGWEYTRTPSAWVATAGFAQFWNEHGV